MKQLSELGWPAIIVGFLLLVLLNVALTPYERFKYEWKIVINLPLKDLIELLIVCVITFIIGFSI